MKSTEFLKEENSWSDDDSFEKQVTEIQNYYGMNVTEVQMALSIRDKCQPYLNRVDHKPISEFPLYRGIKHTSNQPFVAKTERLEYRVPADTPELLHHRINNFFEQNYGAPFRNAVFANGDYSQVGEYGDEYIIFPIGNFKTLWSPDFKDMWIAYHNYETSKKRNAQTGGHSWHVYASANGIDPKSDPESIDFIDVLKNFEFRTEELRNGIKSGKEIMVYCKQYLGINRKLNTESLEGIEKVIQIK